MQSAAFAADTTISKSSDTTAVVGEKAKKKGFSIGKAISHVFGSKDKEASKSVASSEPAIGAY